MRPEAARAAEDSWSVWHAAWVDRLLLSRNPGFAAVAILTLALGIGMNTGVTGLASC